MEVAVCFIKHIIVNHLWITSKTIWHEFLSKMILNPYLLVGTTPSDYLNQIYIWDLNYQCISNAQ